MHDASHERSSSNAGAEPATEAGREGADVLGEVIARLAKRNASFTRYRIQGEVARGGMDKILRVHDEDLHRDLAMKVILARGQPETSSGAPSIEPNALGRFLEEAQVTGQLDHPGIVPVHEMGLDADGSVYFTMRLVAGRDLEQIFGLVRTPEEGWTQARAVGAVLKVCEAVAYAHDKGVIHRDLKPANVMVGRFGEVYVLDWGLARVLGRDDKRDLRPRSNALPPPSAVYSSLSQARITQADAPFVTMDGDIIGTPAYMSPEQARGDLQALGSASDVYAVGAILYQLLAGHPPFLPPGKEPDAISVWRRVREGPPEPIHERNPDAPSELVAIAEKAMAREPAQRYAGMLELAEDLRAYLEGHVVHAFETGALAEMRKWILRNRALAGTIAAATVLIVLGSATAALVLANKNDQLVVANEKSHESEGRAIESAKLAHENEIKAESSAAIAEERATKILRLSDSKRLEQLESTAAALWPANPANVARYESWLAQSRELVARLPEHESALEEIRKRAQPGEESGLKPGPRSFAFVRTEDRWQHDNQAELVLNLRSFVDQAKGRIAEVERRLEFARTVLERTVSGKEASARWAEAIRAIADSKQCPVYRGLVIRPQIGLFPLGADPRSGLWEFAHIETGALPARDSNSGRCTVDGASGIVFVLLPGGTFTMGAQNSDPHGSDFDPAADPKEAPVHEVTLSPFFLSKYEMTQGQWLRFTGQNPSAYNPGTQVGGKSNDLSHPVEQVSWSDCNDVLQKLGLVLPTEAQWEYAARSGTTTPWWTGIDRDSLEGAANLADQSAARVGANWPGIADWPELDDGWAATAPVGSFRPSAFGLHDMHGNVWEWCRDWFGTYDSPVSENDGERAATDKRFRMNRGGGFYHDAAHARSAYRNNSSPETRINHLGLRPARVLER